MIDRIPHLGSGLGFRAALKPALLAAKHRVDCVEILVDRYIDSPHLDADLDDVAAAFPHVIAHGVDLSIGSPNPPDRRYLLAIKRICDRVRSSFYSEHLAVTRAPGLHLGGLSPLPRTEEALRQVTDNVRRVQEVLERPLVLETITEVIELPHQQLSTPEFLHRLVDATGCGILLDLTNVYINATNHHFDPVAFIDALPLHAVVYVHLAGGYMFDDIMIDGHCRPVHEEVFEHLAHLAGKTSIRGAILEHDIDFPALEVLLDQVDRARRILGATHALAGQVPGTRPRSSR